MRETEVDIVIVGGGLVGTVLAIGLAQHHFKVAVIEKKTSIAVEPDKPFDSDGPSYQKNAPGIRVSAINCASVSFLKQLGIWQKMEAMSPHILRAKAYQRVETWENERSLVSFDSTEIGLTELGFFVENDLLLTVLWEISKAHKNIHFYDSQTSLRLSRNGVSQDHRGWELSLDEGEEILRARLVVGADGAHSQVRKRVGIPSYGWDYKQACLLITVYLDHDAGNTTWQKFTPAGPRAFLPLSNGYASLAWYDTPERIAQLQSLSTRDLEKEIAKHYPTRLGPCSVVKSAAFPLFRHHARYYVLDGIALVGDAAHSIHPLAGQGVNLGYRDVISLFNVLVSARSSDKSWAGKGLLLRYQDERYKDNFLMQSSMDLLHLAFSNNFPPLRYLRQLGFTVAERSNFLKKQALRYATGIT